MANQDFEQLKREIVEENEKTYGDEIREKYGEETVESSNQVIMGLTEERWTKSEQLRAEYEALLKKAVNEHLSYADEQVRKMCKLHGEWMSMFWEEGTYSKETHLALADVYASDERFKQYYESIESGATDYLINAIRSYWA